MQRVLEKMARQLNEYDEASLMALWEQFAGRVHDFEPTKRWEEAAVGLCLIQAVHWKNQLFNYNLALTRDPEKEALPPLPAFFGKQEKKAPLRDSAPPRKATVLSFPEKTRPENDADKGDQDREK